MNVLTRDFVQDALTSGLIAAVTSGLPSTLWALCTGRDVLEATRAAGAMLISADSTTSKLILAATVIHLCVSMFWAAVLTYFLPRKYTLIAALLSAVAIAVFDLRIVGPLFPEVHSLPFGPQLADHLAWGATVGIVLSRRWQHHQ